MTDAPGKPVPQQDPAEAWTALQQDPTAQLVDVRTRPEWTFVGIPDLTPLDREAILAEWRSFPHMSVAEGFADALLDRLAEAPPRQLFFICRSGARSLEAAAHTQARADARGIEVRCINVAEGFEGDLDAARHRGAVNGWKARGLAWRQS